MIKGNNVLNEMAEEMNDYAKEDIQAFNEMLTDGLWSTNKPEVYLIDRYCFRLDLDIGVLRLYWGEEILETKLEHDTIMRAMCNAPKTSPVYAKLQDLVPRWILEEDGYEFT